MKTLLSRMLAVLFLAAVAGLLFAGASAARKDIREPDKLVILSTADVKGKTAPCG